MEKIVLIGMGGHARSMIESIEAQGKYQIVGYTDISDRGTYKGYPYLGTDDVLGTLYKTGIQNAAIALFMSGKGDIRERIYSQLKAIGYSLPVIIDPSAIVASNAILGEGTFIGKRSVINAAAVIGKVCIINTGTIIEHDNVINDFCHIAVGSVLCGEVKIGRMSFVGANVTVIPLVRIGSNCVIGAGSTVLRDVNNDMTVYGIVH